MEALVIVLLCLQTFHHSLAQNIIELPEPHLVILGATGVGKSSLSNVLLGQEPDCDNCTFAVCSGGDSCTKNTSYAVGNFVGREDIFTLIDTPGFGDSDNDDNVLINEMIDALKNSIQTTNGFVLLFNGQNERFDTKAQQMIREMEALFGKGFWDHVILGVSFWKYDDNSIMGRNKSGKTEDWWKQDMNSQLQEKFHLTRDLDAVFIDSWAKQDWNLDDETQQEAFNRETAKLWNLFSDLDQFEFKTIQDVIEELAMCQNQLDCLSGEIQNAIHNLQTEMIDRQMEIGILQSETFNLEVELQKTQTNLSLDIKNLNSKVDTETQNLMISIQQNHDLIIQNEENIENLHLAPLGSIMAWIPKTNANQANIDLPKGWIKCDGRAIPEGIWTGSFTPNLNGEGRFLRGGQDNYVLTLEEDMFQEHGHVDNGHTHEDRGHGHKFTLSYLYNGGSWGDGNGGPHFAASTSSQIDIESAKADILTGHANIGNPNNGKFGHETRPKNMAVIWIMRIY